MYLLSLTTWQESLPPQFIGLVVLTKKKKVQITEYSGDYTNKAYQWLYLEWWFIICILEKCCQLLMLHVKEKNEWKKKQSENKSVEEKNFLEASVCVIFVRFEFRRDTFVNV